jgi:hypothetical protein
MPFARTAAAVAAAIASFGLPAFAVAGASVVVPVAQDESVCSFAPEKNYAANTNRGGLFVGSDGTGTGVSRFYLMFDIPASIKPDDIVGASLWATYFDDLDRRDNGVSRIHFVASDDWTEDSLTWENQPGPTFGVPEATFDARAANVGDVVKFDVSSIVKQEVSAGDRLVSFLFAASNESATRENRNWEYFAEREFNPDKAFHLTLMTTARVGGGNGGGGGGGGGGAIPAPLPAAAWPALATLAGAAGVTLRKRLRRR